VLTTSMNIATLFGNLREHELELGRLKEEDDGEKRHIIPLKSFVKSVAKSNSKKVEYADDDDDYNSDSEALRLMVKRFSKFLKNKNKTNSNSVEIKRSSRKQEKHVVPTCYECGKMGHIKPECLVLKLKQKEKGAANKHEKKMKAYNNDSSSSSESDGSIEEETNLCLMAGTCSSKSSVSNFKSNDDENNYYELIDAFNKLHKEATKLQKSNNKHRGEIKWLEGRVKQLEEENENLITSLEKLEKSKKHFRSKDDTSSPQCEKCPGQLEKTDYLMKTLSKFTLGRSNLDAVL